MERASESASEYNERLFSLAARLGERDIVVTRLHVDWFAFGSWELWLESGPQRDRYSATKHKGSLYPVPAPDVLRFSWDGREGFLDVATSPTRRWEQPDEWSREPSRHFNDLGEALRFVEARAVQQLVGEA